VIVWVGMKAIALRVLPVVVLPCILAAGGAGVAGCSNGTTPVCDDAGSCLILAPTADGGQPSSGDDGGEDGPAD
jgi:hypothetical protein